MTNKPTFGLFRGTFAAGRTILSEDGAIGQTVKRGPFLRVCPKIGREVVVSCICWYRQARHLAKSIVVVATIDIDQRVTLSPMPVS